MFSFFEKITVAQAATILQCSRSKVYKLIEGRVLRASKRGRRWGVRLRSVRRLERLLLKDGKLTAFPTGMHCSTSRSWDDADA